MSEPLVVGVIADTTTPGAVLRLLGDLGRLAALDTGFSRVEVVVLENPSSEPDPCVARGFSEDGLHIHQVPRASQERDVAQGRFGHVQLDAGRQPIATARTLVQRYAFDRTRGTNAPVWILDEDMRLSPLLEAMARGEPPLSERVHRLREASVDVALGRVLGAPLLPARCTVRVNLEDVRRHLDVIAELPPDAPWPDRSAENERVRSVFPEYYYDLSRAHGDAGGHAMWLERTHPGETVRSVFGRLAEAVSGLVDGIPITRTLPERPPQESGPSLLARGGNTLVLRPALLDLIPNVAPRLGGRVCRRSDMLWARLCMTLECARFALAPLTTLQDRSGPGRSSFGVDKVVDDVRGSALVGALDDMIDHGALVDQKPLSQDTVTRALEVYVAKVRERLDAVHRSEERVRGLLTQIVTMLGAPERRPVLCRDPAHARAVERMLVHVSNLSAAYEERVERFDPSEDRADVERFFLGLGDEIEAFRT